MAVKKLILASSVIAMLGIVSIAGFGVVSAQGGSTNGNSSIVDTLAKKFNVKSADVQQVFDEERAAREAERKAEFTSKLDQAVKDGKITADQESKLIAKLEELKTNRPDFKNMTDSERKAAKATMETKRADFKAWLTANNIPVNLVPMFGKGHGGPGIHAPRGEAKEAAVSTEIN